MSPVDFILPSPPKRGRGEAGRHMRRVAPWNIKGFWQDGFNDTELHVGLPEGVCLSGWLVCVLPSGEGRNRSEE